MRDGLSSITCSIGYVGRFAEIGIRDSRNHPIVAPRLKGRNEQTMPRNPRNPQNPHIALPFIVVGLFACSEGEGDHLSYSTFTTDATSSTDEGDGEAESDGHGEDQGD